MESVRELALLYQANRLYGEARACYRVVSMSPGGLSARDHYYLAAIAQEESDLPSAEEELRASLQADPGHLRRGLRLRRCLFKTGRAVDAAKEYEAALKADPNNPLASLGLARVELQGGNDNGAVARLRELVIPPPRSDVRHCAPFAQVLDRRGRIRGGSRDGGAQPGVP